MEGAIRKRELYENFLKKVPILSSLTEYERATIADALEPVYFDVGDVILKQGELGDTFYIVQQGDVEVTQSRRNPNSGEWSKPIHLTRLAAGDYFGEIALLKNTPRAATVTALTGVTCIGLNRKDFSQLLGPCENILKRNMDAYKSYEDILAQSQSFGI